MVGAQGLEPWTRLLLRHQESPSPLNPLGVEGVGEGGAVAPPAVIANAISDALVVFRAQFNATPIKPEHIVNAIAEGDDLKQKRSVSLLPDPEWADVEEHAPKSWPTRLSRVHQAHRVRQIRPQSP
jgi:hypothetical protein